MDTQELSLTDPKVLEQIKLTQAAQGLGSRPTGNAPISPYGSFTPSEVSLIAASEPPMAWDRESDIFTQTPFSPRSQLSGRFTPTFGNKQDSGLAPSPGTSSKVKGIMNNYVDQSANKEKARRLEQLRSGKFGKSKSGSKKWVPPTAAQIKATPAPVPAKHSEQPNTEETPAGVKSMRANWEKGGISPRQVEAPKKPSQKEEGFGNVMKRFKELEGSEKPKADIKAEKVKKLSQMTAVFEQPKAKKPPMSPRNKSSISSNASEGIRGKAAMFEQKK